MQLWAERAARVCATSMSPWEPLAAAQLWLCTCQNQEGSAHSSPKEHRSCCLLAGGSFGEFEVFLPGFVCGNNSSSTGSEAAQLCWCGRGRHRARVQQPWHQVNTWPRDS